MHVIVKPHSVYNYNSLFTFIITHNHHTMKAEHDVPEMAPFTEEEEQAYAADSRVIQLYRWIYAYYTLHRDFQFAQRFRERYNLCLFLSFIFFQLVVFNALCFAWPKPAQSSLSSFLVAAIMISVLITYTLHRASQPECIPVRSAVPSGLAWHYVSNWDSVTTGAVIEVKTDECFNTEHKQNTKATGKQNATKVMQLSNKQNKPMRPTGLPSPKLAVWINESN